MRVYRSGSATTHSGFFLVRVYSLQFILFNICINTERSYFTGRRKTTPEDKAPLIIQTGLKFSQLCQLCLIYGPGA